MNFGFEAQFSLSWLCALSRIIEVNGSFIHCVKMGVATMGVSAVLSAPDPGCSQMYALYAFRTCVCIVLSS